jgi:ubiquinone/menaquinone biosynthesis C-methylase UbiE
MIKPSITQFLKHNKLVVISILRQNVVGDFELKRVYESKQFLDDYTSRIELQKPELAILEELRSELPNMRMLDIGVGTGRTTQHFAGLVKEYVGVDYSGPIIKSCRLKFPQYRFEVADARALSLFSDAYFDFVMFSFNGIDSVEHEGRLAILRELHRVTRTGGYFSFSTHNLNYWNSKLFEFSKNPVVLSSSIFNLLLSRFLNRKVWQIMRQTTKKRQYVMVCHKYLNYLIRSYYVTPNEQLRQLEVAGFSNNKAFDLQNGKIFRNPKNLADKWIYFLVKAT